MNTKSFLIRATTGTLGVSSLVAGGYYSLLYASKSDVEPEIVLDSKKVQKVKTFWEVLENDYQQFTSDEWNGKFEEFKRGNNRDKFTRALEHGRGDDFKVLSADNKRGGEELKNWCEFLFKLKENQEAADEDNIENIKLFCVKLKTSSKTNNP